MLKERALARTAPPDSPPGRYGPPDPCLPSEPILLGLGGEQDDVPLDSDSDVAALATDVSFADFGALSDCQLKGLIRRLRQREVTVSYERRILHAKIDLLCAEQVARLRQRYPSDSSSG